VRLLQFASIPLAVAALTASLLAQPVFTGLEIFPSEEFAARRAKVIEQIGDGVAIVLGTTEPPGEVPFRQNSQFFLSHRRHRASCQPHHRRENQDDDGVSADED